MPGIEKGTITFPQTMAYNSPSRSVNVSDEAATLWGKNKETVLDFGRKDEIHVERKPVPPKQKETFNSLVTNKSKEQQSMQERKSSVFKGKMFCFSHAFPEDQRSEIVEWVNQGGESMFRSAGGIQTIYVSSHWVRSCLEDGSLLDVRSHILYSPLPCQTPLPGFETLRFCVSHYEEKDRLLQRNKVTHLLCKFAHGPKYDAASKWGIVPVTSDWVYECVRQNQVVCPDNYYPKELATQDREAGIDLATQFHTQSVPVASVDNDSLFLSHSEDREKSQKFWWQKWLRVKENDAFPMDENPSNFARPLKSGNDVASGREFPNVADTIDDLLEQTSKIQDLGVGGFKRKLFCSTSEQYNSGNHSVTGLSRHWINRVQENDDACKPPGDGTTGTYGNFSETQTESQVVGYEEDLSGRQMLIDRVRTRSSLT
ncbi:hypothetical protein Bca52824_019398 [Brassica carinata]|uniref:BRCT domain-containing protein n=1 Tax=Brassica carinata TaxID=52824 RepID=A0A8X7VRH0_BRACI|nr:hypothetical protein Bca52824_019398 [Brassica carinata]